MKETLTQRGSAVIGSLLIFFLITNLPADPIFSVASSILLLIFTLEAVKFRLASKTLGGLRLTRHIDDDSVFVGERLNVKLEAEHYGSKIGALLELQDLVPSGLEVIDGSNIIVEGIKGPQKLTTTYTLKAAEIGKKTYEGVEVWLFDRLGLFVARKNLACSSSFKVYPKLPLVHMEIRGRPRLATRLSERGSSRRSIGTEFTGIRDYIPGDDHRMIAWKAMAKSPTYSPMTKEHEQMKVLDVFVVFLAKPSMRDGPLGQRKIDKAVESSLTLASHALKEGYSISFIFPQGSRLGLASGSIPQLVKSIADLDFKEVSDSEIIEFIRTCTKKRSLILIVTDLPYPETIDLETIHTLRLNGHIVYLIFLHTPTFFERSEKEVSEEERLTTEILDKIEERHVREHMLRCSSLGLNAYLCDPNDVSIKMIEAFTEARRIPLP